MLNIEELLINNLGKINHTESYRMGEYLIFFILRKYCDQEYEKEFLNSLDKLTNKKCTGLSYHIEIHKHLITVEIYSTNNKIYKKSFNTNLSTFEYIKLLIV